MVSTCFRNAETLEVQHTRCICCTCDIGHLFEVAGLFCYAASIDALGTRDFCISKSVVIGNL